MIDPISAVAIVLALGVGAQWIAWRLQVPSILLLLAVGVALGPGARILDPDRVFGSLLLPFVSASVAVILFEGGLSLSLREVRGMGGTVRLLVSAGALVTATIAVLSARALFGLDAGLAILLGSVLVVTGPTVIGPLLAHIRPSGAAGGILRWEGILIDPIGAILALLTFEAIVASDAREATATVLAGVGATAAVGFGFGIVGAGVIVVLLKRYLVPDFLHNAVSLTLVIGAFSLANHISHDSGLLAVTVMGIGLATQQATPVQHLLEFKESLRVLLLSALFVVLAARMDRADLRSLGLDALAFVVILIVIARPLSVAISTIRSKLTWQERVFIAAVAPRGIVAAAVSSIFAIRLADAGHADAERLVPITFAVIIGTIGVYGLGAPWLARRLGLATREQQGVLIIGAHPWARALAASLKDEGIRVLLTDTDRANVTAAHLDGLDAYYGSVLSEFVREDLDLAGIGRVLAVTGNDEVNALAARTFSAVFGANNVFQLVPKATDRRRALAPHLRGRLLFGPDETYARIEERFAEGARPKTTRLSEQFDYEAFRTHHGGNVLALVVFDGDGTVSVRAADDRAIPAAGSKVLAFVSIDDVPSAPE